MLGRPIAALLFILVTCGGFHRADASEAEFIEFRRNALTEERLLNQQLDSRVFAESIDAWDETKGEWRKLDGRHLLAPQTRVIIVNLWAFYCQPCIREIPLMLEAIRNAAQGRENTVQTFFLAEQTLATDLQQLLQAHSLLRRTSYYSDNGGRIRQSLPCGSHLPVTLIFDRKLVVRYAVVGAIEARIGSLKEKVELLLKSERP